MLKGSCHCKSVQFEISSELYGFRHCHCHTCRKVNGTAFATSVLTASDGLRIVNGREALQAYQASAGKTRYFCSHCGSPIYAQHENDPSFVILRAGTIDDLPSLPLQAHIWTAHQVHWYDIPHNAPHYPGALT